MSHLLPMVVVLVELLINKVRIPLHHIIHSSFFSGLYILCAYVGQIASGDVAAYPSRLNFNCMQNFYYLVNDIANDEAADILKYNTTIPMPGTCLENHHHITPKFACYDLYDTSEINYTCNITSSSDSEKLYDHYQNRNAFIYYFLISNSLQFIIFYLLHHLKARNVVGFNKA